MNAEIWADILGYEGYYQISSLGNVRSVDRTITQSNGHSIQLRGRPKKLSTDKDGYKGCTLSMNGVNTYPRVHRLVAKAFIPNPNNLREVNHIDGNKCNNCFNNLEWVTRAGNEHHAIIFGLKRKRQSGEHVHPVQVYCKQTDIIYKSIKDASEQLNLNYDYLGECIREHRPCHNYIFRAVNPN